MAPATSKSRSKSRRSFTRRSAPSRRRSKCSPARKAASIIARSTTPPSAFIICGIGSPTFSTPANKGRGHRDEPMTTHRLDAAPDTVHWGYFDAKLKPLITVDPGDTVVISSVSGALGYLPDANSGLVVPEALRAIHASVKPRLGGPHILTGPVAVRGAKAGQVLEVRIKAVELHSNWGYNFIRPLFGALPNDFDKLRLMHIPLDKERMVGRLPWGLELPLKPFFGIMAVAPPAAWGEIASPPPRRNE